MAILKIPTDTSQATLGYLLADGSIPLTADWDAGAFKITANEFRLNDNEPLNLGSGGSDASLLFNGTDVILDPGTGDLIINKDGTSSTGAIAFGAEAGGDARIYHSGTNLIFAVTTGLASFGSTAVNTGFLTCDVVSGTTSLRVVAGNTPGVNVFEVVTNGLLQAFTISDAGAFVAQSTGDVKGLLTLSNAISALRIGSGGTFITNGSMTTRDITASMPLLVDGTTDAVQVTVQGHSTQTNDIFLVEDKDSTEIFAVAESAPYATLTGDAAAQEIGFLVDQAAIKTIGDFTSGLGFIVENDGTPGRALLLTAGASNCAFQYDPAGGFQIQENARARIIVGDESGNTTILNVSSDNSVTRFNIKANTTHVAVTLDGPVNGERSIDLREGVTTKWKFGMDNTPVAFRPDFIIKQTNNANPEFLITTDSLFGMSRDGLAADPLGQLHIEQTSTSAALPVLLLDQRDVSEEGIKFTLNAASPVDADIKLFTVDVTGVPTLLWDESEDDFNFSAGVTVESREVNRYAYSV